MEKITIELIQILIMESHVLSIAIDSFDHLGNPMLTSEISDKDYMGALTSINFEHSKKLMETVDRYIEQEMSNGE